MSSAYIGVKEVRGQVPGTTCNGARTNSAINNSQNSGYIRAPEYYTVLEEVGLRDYGIKR